MKITHTKKIFAPVIVTLESLDEVRIIANILGDLAEEDVKRLCYNEIKDAMMAIRCTDLLYDRLVDILEEEE